MNYENWETEKEYSKILTKINENTDINKSGIQMMYENKSIYIDDTDNQTLIIGDTGSGKTQSIMLPLVRTAIKAGESLVISDIKGEICKSTAKEFEKKGYNVIILDIKNNELGSRWNPFTLAYKLYKDGKKSESVKLIEEIGHYLMYSETILDPFWINSATDYFVGLALYLFENAKEEEINLNSIFSLSNTINEGNNLENFIKKIDKNSNIYYNLSGTLTSPKETRGGIISTFIERIKRFISTEGISNLLTTSDFDLSKITTEKTVVFIVSGINDISSQLIPLFTKEVIYSKDNYGTNERRLNIILDEFDDLDPILNFNKILHYSRTLNTRFTIFIKSFKGIEKKYSKETSEIIKASFSNFIYLWSNDIDTLTEISKLCGNTTRKNKSVPLISVEELKLLKQFEAIIFKQRMKPFKTKLLPDYKMNWIKEKEEYIISPIKKNDIKIYNL